MLKRSIEFVLLKSGAVSISLARRAGSLLVLAYHNVVGERRASGDTSLHLPLDQFVSQLDVIEECASVVSLDDESGERDRLRVALTFDDAYAGALELAIPELQRRQLPATIFVAPGLLGAAGTWWDQYLGQSVVGAEEIRGEALATHGGDATKISRWMSARGVSAQELPAEYGIASEQQLARVAMQPGVTLGCHTWDHPNLAALPPTEVHRQLRQSMDWLGNYSSYRPWIAYPYGMESPTVRRICRELGLVRGYRVSGGFGKSGGDPLGRARYNVASGLSLDGFRLRLAGILSNR